MTTPSRSSMEIIPLFIFRFLVGKENHRYVGSIEEFNYHWNQLYRDTYGLAQVVSQIQTNRPIPDKY